MFFSHIGGRGKRDLSKQTGAGIPIIATDAVTPGVNPQEQYEQYIAFIGPNDEQAGYDQAKYLIERVQPAADGKKYIAALEGTLGTSVTIWRTDGLMRALKEHPEVVLAGIQTGNYMRDVGQRVTEDFLAAHPNLGGIWSANDEMALGALNAIKRAGKVPGKDIFVSGLNLDPPAVQAIEDGEMLWSTGGHWLMGGFALVMLYDHIHGYPIPKELSHVQLDLAAVTKENVDAFYAKYPGGQPTYNAREFSRVFNENAQAAYFELAID